VKRMKKLGSEVGNRGGNSKGARRRDSDRPVRQVKFECPEEFYTRLLDENINGI
jgi:hypothetical protein